MHRAGFLTSPHPVNRDSVARHPARLIRFVRSGSCGQVRAVSGQCPGGRCRCGQCRADVAMPSCQALAPAAVAAFAWAIFRLTTALGGSCCALTQRLMKLTMAMPVIPAPHRPIRPPVATRANPTIMALEFAELAGMPVMDDRVLVIVFPRCRSCSGG